MKTARHLALILGACCTLSLTPSAATPPKKFWLVQQNLARLGEGYSVVTGDLTQSLGCVSFVRQTATTPSVEWSIDKFESLSDMLQSGGMSFDVAFNAAAGSAAATGSDVQVVQRTRTEQIVTAHVTLRQREETAYNPRSRPDYSLRRCGTHYVSRIAYGAGIALQASVTKELASSVLEANGTFSIESPQYGKSTVVMQQSFKTLNQTSLFSQRVKVVGTTRPPDLSGTDPTAIVEKLTTYLGTLASPKSDLVKARLGITAIELTPYTSLETPSAAIDKLMDWLGYLIDVAQAEHNASLYVDGSSYSADGLTGLIEAERRRIVKLLTDGRRQLSLRGTLPRSLDSEPGSVPQMGERPPVVITGNAAAANQTMCRTLGSPTLLVIQGSWQAGDGADTVRNLCDNPTKAPGLGMICEGTGEIRDVTPAGQRNYREWLLGRDAIANIRFSDAGSYSDNKGAITASCRPYFDVSTRKKKVAEAAACESANTAAATGARCVSFLK